jgi:hypothetical protein
MLETADKSTQYAQLLRNLPAGLSEWAIHPGLNNAELLAMEGDSKHVRQADFDFLISPEAQTIVKEEGIILLDYRPLQVAWQEGQ